MNFLNQLLSFLIEMSPTTWMLILVLMLLLLLLWQRARRLPTRSKAETGGIEPEPAVIPADTSPRQAPATIPDETKPDESAFSADGQPVAAEAPEETVSAETTTRMPPGGKDPVAAEKTAPVKLSFTERLQNGLAKTRARLSADLDKLLSGEKRLDEDMLEELEELMITADIGVETTMKIIARLSGNASKIDSSPALKKLLRSEILALMPTPAAPWPHPRPKPEVIMVVGVNGVGKTTTIGKIAAKHTANGRKVLIGAADTFRAAAVEQVSIWAERAGADIVKHREGADPAAVAFDTVEAAIARNTDVVLIDTAGRLHTKVNLMEELKKIKRAISKKLPDAPHEILLVIDATTGQNALMQAEMFHAALGLTGIALTKLDGTARGGIVVGICRANEIPLRYVGVGETIDDLQTFDPSSFVEALF
jgi:fused signal recognition particle receptor